MGSQDSLCLCGDWKCAGCNYNFVAGRYEASGSGRCWCCESERCEEGKEECGWRHFDALKSRKADGTFKATFRYIPGYFENDISTLGCSWNTTRLSSHFLDTQAMI